MDLKTILEQENHNIDTVLCGLPFNISAERNIYNVIRNKYKSLALTAMNKFTELYKEFKDIEDLIDNAPNAFMVACEDSFLEVIKDIISIDIYTIDKDTIIDKAFKGVYFNDFSKSYNKISKKYDEIITKLQGAEYARERRKQTRSRWQSATFGGNAIDAWSNQLNASAMNAAEGVAHSVVNAIGNAMDRAEARAKLKEIFNSSEHKQDLIDSVYLSCFNLYLLLIEIVTQNSNIKIVTISNTDVQKANSMFNNLTAINLSDEKRIEFIHQILKLNPYNYNYYKTLITKFGDKDNSIGKFSEYHGISSVILKNNILKEYIKGHIGETEEDAHNCQLLMEKYAEEIGLPKDKITQAKSLIEEQLKILDLRYRTVDGFVFETREEADIAKDELSQIQKIMDTIKPPTNSSTLSYEKDLLNKKQEMENLKTCIKNKYIGIINNYLLDFDKKFRKENVLSSGMTREEAGIVRALNYAKTLPVSNYQELDDSVEKLKAFLPEVGISQEQATASFMYFNECELRLNTVDGVVFPNRDEAKKGYQDLHDITVIMSKVKPPKKDYLLDYERNLFEVKAQLEQFQTNIKYKYIRIIDDYLVKFDSLFKQTGVLAKAETREQAAQSKALKYVKSIAPANCNYNDIDNATKALNDFLPYIGIDLAKAFEATQYLQSQENRLNTVDGIIFQTREDAAFAIQEFAKIKNIMSYVTPPTNDPLLNQERNLKFAESELNKLQTPLKNKYLNIIKTYLSDFDEKFRKVSVIKTCTTREEAAKERALKFVKSKTYNFVTDVDNARQELNMLLPELGINVQQAENAFNYLKLTEDKLNGVVPESKLKSLFGRRKK